LLKHLGIEGYARIVKQCMRLTFKLAREIPKIKGLDIVTEPTVNVVGLKSEIFNVSLIAKELRLRKWAVSLFPRHIRLVIMPHVRESHIDSFLNDLREISKKFGG